MNANGKCDRVAGFYQCEVKSCRIPKNIKLLINDDGWFYRWNKDDVTEIYFNDCDLDEVPQGLKNIYPNLRSLVIKNSKLKMITKDDLAEYKTFIKIDLSGNEIDFLPENLFEGFENLEIINFEGNKLSIVNPCILDGLNKLKLVNLNGTEKKYGSFDVKFAVRNFDREMIELKKNLIEEFCSNIENRSEYILKLQSSLQLMKKDNASFIKEIEELKQKLLTADKTIEDLKIAEAEFTQSNQSIAEKLEENKKVIEDLTHQLQDLKLGLENKPNQIIEIENKTIQIEGYCADIKAFIQDETTKDFKIIIDSHEFPVHKFLLAARSPTLAELLKNNPEVENLNLVDISVEIFEKILKFLYTDELPGDGGTNFTNLFAAAGKLKIEELKNYAAVKSMELIDAENSLEILNLSNKYGHDELKLKAFTKIKVLYPKVELKDEWITDAEKIEKLIQFFKKMEETEKSLQNMMI